ncbi:hypothetical protein MGYG_08925 [Nannizzia gypsea CBS 118893]|uniref:RINT-1 family protein n=1 Tax=Arthroderma gypseum (strain ATCC MYA-4604 / CBS 118893) TaxID=535722 RepID=E5QZZ8_ARTGP|nr:hypothetical protein MGYG_08925 [Nannizzia gypsea CBS 118893]EFQ98247.1 hypothetical protein MGYG_08925 [Nannizzia gypsea CBS 118893]
MAGSLSAEDATRLVDFVNDKIQSIEDLQSLDTLLQSLQEQQEIQRQQLLEAEEILKNATKASNEHAEAVRKEAEAFKQHQTDIDHRLLVVTQSEHSDEAVRKFEDSIARLQRLDVSQGYLELLSNIDQLNNDAMKTMKSSPHDALRSYAQLRSIETSISSSQEIVEGATPYLLDYVTKVSDILKDSIRVEYTEELQSILDKMKWPMKELPAESLIDEWMHLVQTLRLLATDFSFLSRTLAVAPRRRIANHVLLTIQTYIWDSILMRNSFSTSGAAQLSVDVSNICDTVDAAIGTKTGEILAARTMKKLQDGLFILNLEIKAGKDHLAGTGDDTRTMLSLWEAEKRLFANNESARGVLSELGIDTLTEADARSVLERRVEVRS